MLWLTWWGDEPNDSDMVLFFSIIKDYRRVEEILLAFVENDITGATVLEGQGMGQILGNLPIFADMRGMFPGSSHDSQIIFSVLDENKAQRAMTLCEEIVGDMSLAGHGVCFTVPLISAMGVAAPLK